VATPTMTSTLTTHND